MLTTRAGSWGRVVFAALILALALPLAAQSANEKDLKDIGHRGVGNGLDFYSLEKEIALGKTLAAQVDASSRIETDPIVNEYVNRVVQNLVRHSDAKVPFTVRVIVSPQINAMSLPGGFLFVNSGLILAADNESELAGVLAHEIAHVAARHGTRMASKAELINYATLPLIFVGGGIGMAARSAASVAIPMSFLKFSRSDEKEADYLGIQYMYESGYDPQGMVQMFEKLLAMQKKQPGAFAKAFETHPATPDRIAASEKEISTLLPPRPEYIVDTSQFEQVKARLAMLLHEEQTNMQLHGYSRPSLIHPNGSAVDTSGPPPRPTLKHRNQSGN